MSSWKSSGRQRSAGGSRGNEFLAAFIEGMPVAGPPDLLVVLDEETFTGISNGCDTPLQTRVSLFLMPAHQVWDSDAARDIFSFRTPGFDGHPPGPGAM